MDSDDGRYQIALQTLLTGPGLQKRLLIVWNKGIGSLGAGENVNDVSIDTANNVFYSDED